MENTAYGIKRVVPIIGLALALSVMLGLVAAHRSSAMPESTSREASAPANLPTIAQANRSNAAPTALKLLKVEPVEGYVGDSFTVTGDGLAPGKNVEFFWSTVDAAYLTKLMADNVEYHERKYEEKRVRLGSAALDAQGRVKVRFVAPEDFGEIHDLYAVVDEKDVARGGFRILRSATMTPSEGPVGTPITMTVKGLGWRGFEQFMAVRYDNKYTGELSAVTTRGTAVFQIRATGPPGKHIIQLNNRTAYAPGAYLNTQQSPQDYIYAHLDNKQEFRFAFNVTSDAGPRPDKLQWPDSDRVARLNSHAPRTTMSIKPASSAVATLNPPSGTFFHRLLCEPPGCRPAQMLDCFS